jgi:hypothetical protein
MSGYRSDEQIVRDDRYSREGRDASDRIDMSHRLAGHNEYSRPRPSSGQSYTGPPLAPGQFFGVLGILSVGFLSFVAAFFLLAAKNWEVSPLNLGLAFTAIFIPSFFVSWGIIKLLWAVRKPLFAAMLLGGAYCAYTAWQAAPDTPLTKAAPAAATKPMQKAKRK